MCPVHSADRWRLGNPTGGVPIHSVGRKYARAAKGTVLIITRTLPGKLPLHANATQTADIRAQGDALATSISGSKYYIRYVPGPACRGSAPLYVPPLSYKRGGMQCYKVDTLRLNLGSHTHSNSQVHTSSQAQYITQWSRVLCSGG
jgi:hypothetical protein